MSSQPTTPSFLDRYRYDRGELTVFYRAMRSETDWSEDAEADFDGWEIIGPKNRRVCFVFDETDAQQIVDALNRTLKHDTV